MLLVFAYMKEKLAASLRHLRTENKLSLQDVADWFGINRASVHAWENPDKKVMPEIERLHELGQRYGVSLDDMLSGAVLKQALHNDTANPPADAAAGGYLTGSVKRAVRVSSVVRLLSDGRVESLPFGDVAEMYLRTDKLPKVGNYYALVVASSDNPALRTGAAILVDRETPYKLDRLSVVTLANGGVQILAPLLVTSSAIRFETLDGNTISVMQSEIASIEYVAGIDSDPDTSEQNADAVGEK